MARQLFTEAYVTLRTTRDTQVIGVLESDARPTLETWEVVGRSRISTCPASRRLVNKDRPMGNGFQVVTARAEKPYPPVNWLLDSHIPREPLQPGPGHPTIPAS